MAPTHPGPAAPAPCPPNTPGILDQWNDIGIKGDFVTRELTYNARDVGEYARLASQFAAMTVDGCTGLPALPPNPRGGSALLNIECDQHCLNYTNCCPSVVCFSPNGEVWSNGITLPMPHIALDGDYGAFWYAEVNQWMIDPLFQPPVSCDPNLIWAEDNGSCQPCVTNEDTGIKTCYYFPLFEECRTAVPLGAPALPAGITLGAQNPTPGQWTGPLSGEPSAGGSNTPTPWSFWLNQLAANCNINE
jgi:hypothetical protein